MSRLFDKLNSCDYVEDRVKETIPGIPVIKIDNVVKYFFEQKANDVASFRYDCLPCVKPPFSVFWIESKNPGLDEVDVGEITSFGTLICPYATTSQGIVKNRYCAYTILESGTEITQMPFYWIFDIDDDGKLLALQIGADRSNSEEIIAEMQKEKRTIITLFWPALLAISFMHCKNVTVTEHNPPEKVQKKRQKGNKPPLTKYYTLDIESMKKVLKSEGHSDEVGLQRALHVCRGHFKDYSNGKGLFGKYKGLYWWDSNIRGIAEAGEIVKDYNVKSPDK